MCGRHALVGRKQTRTTTSGKEQNQSISRKGRGLCLTCGVAGPISKDRVLWTPGPLLHQFPPQPLCHSLTLFLLSLSLSLGIGESLEVHGYIDVRTHPWPKPPSSVSRARREARARTWALRSRSTEEYLHIIHGYTFLRSRAGRNGLRSRLGVLGSRTPRPLVLPKLIDLV